MRSIIAATVLALTALPVVADVTTQQSVVMDVAGAIKMHGTMTDMTTSDKERHDSDLHCEGFMALVCGNVRSGDIVRLDRNLSWDLRPDKKIYTENVFPTAEERAQAQQKMQETLDKMKQCNAKQDKQPEQKKADTSDCDMSPPKVEVTQSQEHATIAGHDTHKASVKLTQTCTNRKTGDVCDFVYGFDTWLTEDTPAGLADQRAFQKTYMTKMGLDPNAPAFKGVMQQFMAGYAPTMKDLADKASTLKGYPMRTTFRLIIGGPKCAQSKSSADHSDPGTGPGSASDSGASGGLSGLAASGAGKLLGGFLAKRQAAKGGDTAAAPGAAAANASPTLPDGYAQVVAFTTETTAVSTDPVSADQFEIPAGWTLEKPKPGKSSEYTCPADEKGK
jgi:hypothetical protein